MLLITELLTGWLISQCDRSTIGLVDLGFRQRNIIIIVIIICIIITTISTQALCTRYAQVTANVGDKTNFRNNSETYTVGTAAAGCNDYHRYE